MQLFTRFQPGLLIAQSRIEAMNEGFRTQQTDGMLATMIMTAAIVIALGLAGGIYLFYRQKSLKTINDPAKLFRELSRAHGLDRGQRNLLQRLALIRGLAHPCSIFLDAQLLLIDPEKDKEMYHPKLLKRFVVLRRLLFEQKQSTATA